MKKINTIFALLLVSIAYSQNFEEYSSHEGVNYGTAFWIEKENTLYQDMVIVGYDQNYEHYGRTFSHQNNGYDTTMQVMTALGMANADTLDANEDGLMDFITTGTDTANTLSVILYTQNSNGSFTESLLPMGGVTSGKLKVADLNHDGHMDFVITGVGNASTYIAKLYTGDGLGDFTELVVPFFANTFGNITFLDANNDNFTDVIITGFSQNFIPETRLYLNDGLGIFTEKLNSGIIDAYFTGLSTGDYDNDGNIDVILSGMSSTYTQYTAIFKNDGLGNFTAVTSNNFKQLYFGTSDFVDYNNDGELDILLTGTDATNVPHTVLYTNNNGVFTEEIALTSIFHAVYLSSSFWSDFDKDGDKDLIISGLDANDDRITKIYRNNDQIQCKPEFLNNTENDVITNITIKNINNDSPDTLGTPTYENFQSISSPINKGEFHNISISGYSLNYPSDITVYIDLNRNFVLTDPGEEFYIGRMPAGSNLNIINKDILIPNNTEIGTMKMRIIKSTNTDAFTNALAPSIITSPCDQNLISGQTEDYTILIKEAPFCPLPTDLSYNITTDYKVEINWFEPIDLTTFNEYNWFLVAEGDDVMPNNIVQSGNLASGITFEIMEDLNGGLYDFYITTDCGTDVNNRVKITLDIFYLDLDNEKAKDKILIYPNPAKNIIKINGLSIISAITIYNLNGKLMVKETIESSEETIDVSMLENGSYILKIESEKELITKKLIIK